MYIVNDKCVKLRFLVLKETYVNGKDVELTAHLGIKARSMLQAGGIFLGGNDAAGLWQTGKGLVDVVDVLLLEKMVVTIG